jgi:hypothetical protein
MRRGSLGLWGVVISQAILFQVDYRAGARDGHFMSGLQKQWVNYLSYRDIAMSSIFKLA